MAHRAPSSTLCHWQTRCPAPRLHRPCVSCLPLTTCHRIASQGDATQVLSLLAAGAPVRAMGGKPILTAVAGGESMAGIAVSSGRLNPSAFCRRRCCCHDQKAAVCQALLLVWGDDPLTRDANGGSLVDLATASGALADGALVALLQDAAARRDRDRSVSQPVGQKPRARSSSVAPLPPGWETVDDKDGIPFFHCAATGDSTYRHPGIPRPPPGIPPPTDASLILPPGWEAHDDDDGQSFCASAHRTAATFAFGAQTRRARSHVRRCCSQTTASQPARVPTPTLARQRQHRRHRRHRRPSRRSCSSGQEKHIARHTAVRPKFRCRHAPCSRTPPRARGS